MEKKNKVVQELKHHYIAQEFEADNGIMDGYWIRFNIFSNRILRDSFPK